jgi:hypothetical protein
MAVLYLLLGGSEPAGTDHHDTAPTSESTSQ